MHKRKLNTGNLMLGSLWQAFWCMVWDASESSKISLGRFAPWVFAQMIGCSKYTGKGDE